MKHKQTKVHTGNAVVDAIVNQPPSETDPNGSYTGKPLDENAIPEQDADDRRAKAAEQNRQQHRQRRQADLADTGAELVGGVGADGHKGT